VFDEPPDSVLVLDGIGDALLLAEGVLQVLLRGD
jgi:hypothetical protein